MTRDEHTNLLRDIKLNLSDEGKVTELLANISDGFNEAVSNYENIEITNNQLTKDNESLRDSNMKLFLRIGAPDEKRDNKELEIEKKMEFSALFNDKGELK